MQVLLDKMWIEVISVFLWNVQHPCIILTAVDMLLRIKSEKESLLLRNDFFKTLNNGCH